MTWCLISLPVLSGNMSPRTGPNANKFNFQVRFSVCMWTNPLSFLFFWKWRDHILTVTYKSWGSWGRGSFFTCKRQELQLLFLCGFKKHQKSHPGYPVKPTTVNLKGCLSTWRHILYHISDSRKIQLLCILYISKLSKRTTRVNSFLFFSFLFYLLPCCLWVVTSALRAHSNGTVVMHPLLS